MVVRSARSASVLVLASVDPLGDCLVTRAPAWASHRVGSAGGFVAAAAVARVSRPGVIKTLSLTAGSRVGKRGCGVVLFLGRHAGRNLREEREMPRYLLIIDYGRVRGRAQLTIEQPAEPGCAARRLRHAEPARARG